jgi:hypothetical protein
MPSWVVDLFACLLVDWWTILEYCRVRDGALLLFVVPVEEKKNDKNFEDLERTLEELKSFYSLFTWTYL